MLNFKKIELEDRERLTAFLSAEPPYLIEHSFCTLFAWGDVHDFRWADGGDFAVVKTCYRGEESFLPPFCLQPECRAEAVRAVLEYAENAGVAPVFSEVGEREVEWLLPLLPGYEAEENRDGANYIYQVSDLTELPGRKYHNKRNHLNNFRRNYPEYCYLPITAELIPLCRVAAERWSSANNIENYPTLLEEKQAIDLIFDHWDELNLKGACIAVLGQIEAFTIGEDMNSKLAAIHIEKANATISGLYSAINQMFLAETWQDKLYVNRAEDLGLPNLRRTKLDYGPWHIAMKYVLKPQV